MTVIQTVMLGWFTMYLRKDGRVDAIGDVFVQEGNSVAAIYAAADELGYCVAKGGRAAVDHPLYIEWIKFEDPHRED
jgi:hypothetical protein